MWLSKILEIPRSPGEPLPEVHQRLRMLVNKVLNVNCVRSLVHDAPVLHLNRKSIMATNDSIELSCASCYVYKPVDGGEGGREGPRPHVSQIGERDSLSSGERALG